MMEPESTIADPGPGAGSSLRLAEGAPEDEWPELLGGAYSLISDAAELGGLDTERERWMRVAGEWLKRYRGRRDQRLQRP